MSIQLTVMSLDFETSVAPSTKVYEKKEITLGRSDDNDVVLDLPEVSGKHAKLTARVSDETGEPQLYLTDLGSSNGTLVENNLVQRDSEIPISPHERIKIGRFLIKPYLNASEFDPNSPDIKTVEIELGAISEEATDDSSTESPERTATEIFETPDAIDTGIFSNGNGAQHSELLKDEEEVPEEDRSDKEALYAAVIDSFDEEPEELEENHVVEKANQEDDILESSSTIETSAAYQPDTNPISGSLTEDVLNLDFVALEILNLTGKVSHKGLPLEGVTVDAGDLGFTTTDANGEFAFHNIPEETDYELSFEKDNYRFDTKSFQGQIGDNQQIEIGATRLYSLSGQVIHKGQPLADVVIDGGELGTVRTSSEGRYSFNNIPEDTEYTLTATKDGFLIGTQTIKK